MYIKVSIPEHFQLKIMPSLYSLMFRRENDVHYIGGAEVLPAPLDAKREAECIENLGQVHQDLIFDTAGRIGRKLDVFAGIKCIDRLDQADTSDLYQFFPVMPSSGKTRHHTVY